MKTLRYSEGIREAFEYLLLNYPDVCLMGQGLWSPWYVGNSMNDLEHQFGKDRIMGSEMIMPQRCNLSPVSILHLRLKLTLTINRYLINVV